MRIGFTILYEAIEQLQHKNFAEFMQGNFDYWIVIEGHAKPGGSTRWCDDMRVAPRSSDGTHEFMLRFADQHKNVIYYSPSTYWSSKDKQVNEAIMIVRLLCNECYLWQVDDDEIWTPEALTKAEKELQMREGMAGGFQFNHLLCKTKDGIQLVGKGDWGDNFNTRLWKWKGEDFVTHEPPRLKGQTSVELLTPRYEHYTMTFEKRVIFKSKYYRKSQPNLLTNWNKLKEMPASRFPLPATVLLGTRVPQFTKNGYIDILR